MRVNREGINPNFDKNVKEYYLLIDEDVKDLENRLKAKRKEYRSFCNETGLTPQYERTKVII